MGLSHTHTHFFLFLHFRLFLRRRCLKWEETECFVFLLFWKFSCCGFCSTSGWFGACDGSHAVRLFAQPSRPSAGPAPHLRPSRTLRAPILVPWPLHLLSFFYLHRERLPRWGWGTVWGTRAPERATHVPAASSSSCTPAAADRMAHTADGQRLASQCPSRTGHLGPWFRIFKYGPRGPQPLRKHTEPRRRGALGCLLCSRKRFRTSYDVSSRGGEKE